MKPPIYHRVALTPTLAISNSFLLPDLSMKKSSDTKVAEVLAIPKNPDNKSNMFVPEKPMDEEATRNKLHC
jgi:hypothetical protein